MLDVNLQDSLDQLMLREIKYTLHRSPKSVSLIYLHAKFIARSIFDETFYLRQNALCTCHEKSIRELWNDLRKIKENFWRREIEKVVTKWLLQKGGTCRRNLRESFKDLSSARIIIIFLSPYIYTHDVSRKNAISLLSSFTVYSCLLSFIFYASCIMFVRFLSFLRFFIFSSIFLRCISPSFYLIICFFITSSFFVILLTLFLILFLHFLLYIFFYSISILFFLEHKLYLSVFFSQFCFLLFFSYSNNKLKNS